MDKRTCVVTGCDRRAHSSQGWCKAHYNRWKRTGDVGPASFDRPGRLCSIDGCGKKHSGLGYCRNHLYRLRSNGDPLITRKPGAPAGETNPAWRGDEVDYHAVHRRLRKLRGRAAEFACLACGCRADEWAYQHTASDERYAQKTGLPYSTDLSDYEPMCIACHHHFDALHGWTRPNFSGRGVSFHKPTSKWRAYVTQDRKQCHLGLYEREDDALHVAAEARRKIVATKLAQLNRLKACV